MYRPRLSARILQLILSAGMLCLNGCAKPPVVEITTFDAAAITDDAMQQLDLDQNGELDRAELDQCPGLQQSLPSIDLDANRSISKAELQRRLQTYIDEQIAILPVPIDVSYRRRPLVGATVELIPEPFLADVIQPARGVTDQYGTVRPSIELDEAISSRGTYGFRSGVYRVTVSLKDPNGKELLPTKYNQDSELGIEIKMEEHMQSLRLDL